MKCRIPVILRLLGALATAMPAFVSAQEPRVRRAVPRIDSVFPSPNQPQSNDPGTIWFDDFDGPTKVYAESAGGLDDQVAFGGAGKSMACLYEKGSQGVGNRKVFFGDSPAYRNAVVRPNEKFDEIYWRIYVKHPDGWVSGGEFGGPDKMSRATSLATPQWAQAMIAHVWSSGDSLTLDPAGGVRGDRVVTTRYNDFDNLHWLGNKPVSKFEIHSGAQTGWWVSVEARAKLNTPGKADGINQLWIDGKLECERTGLDWRGSYHAHGINAVFLEAYWNKGSPVTQRRWFDNFIISTKPIGPVTAPRNPVLLRAPYVGPGTLASWELELAADAAGQTVVWRSRALTPADRAWVESSTGTFEGPLAGQDKLAAGQIYYCRIRDLGGAGNRSDWSPWHQQFITEK